MATKKYKNVKDLSVIDQIRTSFQLHNWLPLIVGAVLGGAAPALTYTVSHLLHPISQGAALNTWAAWVSVWTPVVVAGLTFSGITVYQWLLAAFKNRAKALGLVVLVETVMTCASSVPVMCYLALALLVFVNAVATATQLTLDAKTVRKPKESKSRAKVPNIKVSNTNGRKVA